MKEEKNQKYINIIFYITLILLLVIKIVIVNVQPIKVEPTLKYDDQLMVNQAKSIAEGKWLGDYSNITLVKGPFTPLFMALVYIMNIPFLVGKEIFFGLACIYLIYALKQKINNKIVLVIIYILLLFNPVEFSSELCRMYRDGIYLSLIIFLIGNSFLIFFNQDKPLKKQAKNFQDLGFILSAIILTREETIWLVPFIAFMIIAIVIKLLTKKALNKKSLFLFIIPIILCALFINIICIMNYKYYGVYTINQYWGKEFKDAFGALDRINVKEEKERVPVSREALEIAYKVSPRARKLQNFFEGEEGQKWQHAGEYIKGEINGGFFHWALMEAANDSGYYKDAKTANAFYEGLANEINEACDTGKIEAKFKKRSSISPYFTIKDLYLTMLEMPKTINYQLSYQDVNVKVENKKNVIEDKIFKDNIKAIKQISNSNIVTNDYYNNKSNSARIKLLETITNIYKKYNYILVYISLVAYLLFIIINITKLINIIDEIYVLGILAIIYFSRIYIISFTYKYMYLGAICVSYLSCIYCVQLLFSLLCIIFFSKSIINKIRENLISKKC